MDYQKSEQIKSLDGNDEQLHEIKMQLNKFKKRDKEHKMNAQYWYNKKKNAKVNARKSVEAKWTIVKIFHPQTLQLMIFITKDSFLSILLIFMFSQTTSHIFIATRRL